MMNNGYLGDFGGHKRRFSLWDSRVQEDTWRQMCMDMWAPVWRARNGVPSLDTFYKEQDQYCRDFADYHPGGDGYELDAEIEEDPDSEL